MDISHVVEIISLSLTEVRSSTNRENDTLAISLFFRKKKKKKKEDHSLLDEDCHIQNRVTDK